MSIDGRYSQKNGSLNSTEQAFISAPTTSFETNAKKSHKLGQNSLVNENFKVNELKPKDSRGIPAPRFMENLVKKNPKIARHTLFRGLESVKQSKSGDEGKSFGSTDSNDKGTVKSKENSDVQFTPMEFDRTTMELTETGNVQNESKKYLNQGIDEMNMIEFFGKMRYYPFNIQDNRIFLKTSELLGARSLLLVKNIERHLIENDTVRKDHQEISADDNESTKGNTKSAFSLFKKKSKTSVSRKRKRGMPKQNWVVDRINLESWNKMSAHDDTV